MQPDKRRMQQCYKMYKEEIIFPNIAIRISFGKHFTLYHLIWNFSMMADVFLVLRKCKIGIFKIVVYSVTFKTI